MSDDTFVCPTIGYFPDYYDVTCQRYFYCARVNGSLKPYVYACPPGSSFDPQIKRCSELYDCTVTSTTTENSNGYVCTSAGRFLNYNVNNCTSYIYCVENCENQYVMKYYSCPPNSIFDESSGMCSNCTKCYL